MYFATIAVIIPPDALASIAAAGVAGSPVMKTAAHGTRLAFVAFIVPFMFVYRPALLTLGSWDQILYDTFFAIAAVVMLSAGLEGYALRRLRLWERLGAFAAGFALVVPHSIFDLAGLALIAVLFALQFTGYARRPATIQEQREHSKARESG